MYITCTLCILAHTVLLYFSLHIPVSVHPINKIKKHKYKKTCNAANCQFVPGPYWQVMLCHVYNAGSTWWHAGLVPSHVLRALSFLHIITHSLMVMWPCRVRASRPKTAWNSLPAPPTGQKLLLTVRTPGENDYLSVWKSIEKTTTLLPQHLPSNLSFADSHWLTQWPQSSLFIRCGFWRGLNSSQTMLRHFLELAHSHLWAAFNKIWRSLILWGHFVRSNSPLQQLEGVYQSQG